MRLVFLGTAEFAVPSLRRSAAEHDVLAVVTQPDKPGSRGKPAPRPVADAACELGVPVLTPRRVRAPEAVAEIAALQPDVLVVAAYGQILPQSLLDVPRLGAVNVHASLLPRWRGASPIAHAILAGDAKTGVTIMQMDAGLDTGAMYAHGIVPVPPDATTPSLTTTLAELGAGLLAGVLRQIARGEATATPQPDEGVTLAPRLSREDGEVRWDECSAADVDRRVRALQPWPGVTASLDGTRVRVLAGHADSSAEHHAADADPGAIIELDGEAAVIATREGAYRVDRVLPPGSRAMTAAAFLRGRRTRS